MSYRIEYGTIVPERFQRPKVKRHIRILTALFVLLFSLAVGKFWPDGRQLLREYFIPGEPSITEQAFSCMISELRDGVALEKAVVAFCQEIIDYGTGKVH